MMAGKQCDGGLKKIIYKCTPCQAQPDMSRAVIFIILWISVSHRLWAQNEIFIKDVVLLSSQTCRVVIVDLLPMMINEKDCYFFPFQYVAASLWQVCNLGSRNEASAGTRTRLVFMLCYSNILKMKKLILCCRGKKQRWEVTVTFT